MLERCDCCGAYLEDGGLACEECRKDMKNRINHRNQRSTEKPVRKRRVTYGNKNRR